MPSNVLYTASENREPLRVTIFKLKKLPFVRYADMILLIIFGSSNSLLLCTPMYKSLPWAQD